MGERYSFARRRSVMIAALRGGERLNPENARRAASRLLATNLKDEPTATLHLFGVSDPPSPPTHFLFGLLRGH